MSDSPGVCIRFPWGFPNKCGAMFWQTPGDSAANAAAFYPYCGSQSCRRSFYRERSSGLLSVPAVSVTPKLRFGMTKLRFGGVNVNFSHSGIPGYITNESTTSAIGLRVTWWIRGVIFEVYGICLFRYAVPVRSGNPWCNCCPGSGFRSSWWLSGSRWAVPDRRLA